MSEAGLSILTIRTFGWAVRLFPPARRCASTTGRYLSDMGRNEFEPRWDQEGPYWETPAGLKTYDYDEAVRLDREWANRTCLDRDINDKII